MPLRSATPDVVRRALVHGDALPGTAGFAGKLDGSLVRDVLGRELVYGAHGDHNTWSHDPSTVPEPSLVPAGHVRDTDGDRRVWHLPDPPPATDPDAVIARVRDAILAHIDALPGGIPVAFSGGLDSGIVASRIDGVLYVAGFPDSHDVKAAREAATLLNRELRVVKIDHDDLRQEIPEVARATGRTNAMDIAIALPLYLVAKRAAADGAERLALGQGADELFGGYAKVAAATDDSRVQADTMRGARRETVLTLPAQLERDIRAIRAAGMEPIMPLLHDRVVEVALALPEALLVDGDVRKVALREAADFLPDSIRTQEKKALQYGTYVARELDRLARQAGYKRRLDDHVTQYVESLVAQNRHE